MIGSPCTRYICPFFPQGVCRLSLGVALPTLARRLGASYASISAALIFDTLGSLIGLVRKEGCSRNGSRLWCTYVLAQTHLGNGSRSPEGSFSTA